MASERFKIAYVPWWAPKRLVRKIDTNGFGQLEFVGWVWRQKARLVKNLNHGWIAFIEDQTEELLRTCPSCGQPIHQKGSDE